MALTLGIDVAVRAAHQATLARDGATVWRGRKFSTRPTDLERLWSDLDPADPGDLTVVVEPTRNAWIVLAEWFRRRGARVVMVPTTQSADLRTYYSKHTKNDRIDSQLLARLPLLHPEGLRPSRVGPRRSVAASGQTALDAGQAPDRGTATPRRLLELLGPAWYDVLGIELRQSGVGRVGTLRQPDRDPELGHARLSAFLIPRSRGAWREQRADRLIVAAQETLALWPDGMNFDELAADIANEAAQAMILTGQIHAVEERIANALRRGRPRRDRRLRTRRRAKSSAPRSRPPRRSPPVQRPRCGPLLHRTDPADQPVRDHERRARPDQSRRPATA